MVEQILQEINLRIADGLVMQFFLFKLSVLTVHLKQKITNNPIIYLFWRGFLKDADKAVLHTAENVTIALWWRDVSFDQFHIYKNESWMFVHFACQKHQEKKINGIDGKKIKQPNLVRCSNEDEKPGEKSI